MNRPHLPPYLAKILALEATGQIPRGRISYVEVAHDDGCPLLAGTGGCVCNPEVTLKPDSERSDQP